MDKLFPADEVQCFHVELTDDDVQRIFLLYEQTFVGHTTGSSCRIIDILSTAETMAMERLPVGTKNQLDLSRTTNLEPVFVTTDVDHHPFVAIDGNHRLTAHYVRHRGVNGVKAFVIMHKQMFDWEFIPPLAKTFSR